jgi:hypothetical protein
MAVRVNQSVVVYQQDLNAAKRLLQRIYTEEDMSLPKVVFGTDMLPIPTCFKNPQHPFTMKLMDMINSTMVAATTYTIVAEWRFNPGQVDNLAPNDQRITALRQKLSTEIANIPLVTDLRQNRMKIIFNRQN